MTHTGSDGETPGLSPDEAFALVGNETRMAILRTLWEAYDPYASDNSVPFSEIYYRVEIEDTGNFNYHLGKLTDHFVRQTDDGYVLTQLGFYVVRGVIAGTVGERPSVGPARIDADCPLCAGSVEVVYRDLTMQAHCTQCSGIWDRDDDSRGHLFLWDLPPAVVVDRTPEEAFHATVAYISNRVASFRNGVCPRCSGRVEGTIDVCDEHDPGAGEVCPRCDRHHLSEITDVCTQCKSFVRGPVTVAILDRPTVTAFYHEHGIDNRFETWQAFKRAQTVSEELVGRDPPRIRVTIPAEEDELRLTLTEELEIVDVER